MGIMPQLNPSLNLSECILNMSTPLPRLCCSHHTHSVQAGTPAHTWNEGAREAFWVTIFSSSQPPAPASAERKEKKEEIGGSVAPLILTP